MLSYQHGYHAGGPADLHKHIVLAGLIALLTRKARPVTYMESHAGRGLYDLSGEQATKTGEWKAGIGTTTPDGPFRQVLDTVRAAHGADAYPGSPSVAKALLRPTDRIVLMELHPAEHAALKAAMGQEIEVHKRDGREGLLALSPPKPRRGLALIDPSYERKEEYGETAAFALDLARKWPEAAILIWYPILAAGRHGPMVERLRAAMPGVIIDETTFPAHKGRATGMTGSGLALLNAPYGANEIFRSATSDEKNE